MLLKPAVNMRCLMRGRARRLASHVAVTLCSSPNAQQQQPQQPPPPPPQLHANRCGSAAASVASSSSSLGSVSTGTQGLSMPLVQRLQGCRQALISAPTGCQLAGPQLTVSAATQASVYPAAGAVAVAGSPVAAGQAASSSVSSSVCEMAAIGDAAPMCVAMPGAAQCGSPVMGDAAGWTQLQQQQVQLLLVQQQQEEQVRRMHHLKVRGHRHLCALHNVPHTMRQARAA
jgi:hypothetical protein